MSETAIEVRDLCIDYIPYKKKSIQKSFLKKNTDKTDIVHAVKSLSFSVEKGKIVGIVGKNGSGKSTLLKAIGGIFTPDRGSIDLYGNTISLLSIGVGFKPDLSGRENIMLSGMLLGFTEETILEKMGVIIEFSELKKFIDYPVRTYSSGMHSKLAFAISATLETDILLIDEVLSVGDQHFKEKSYHRMKELIMDAQRTVLIVSHSANTIRDLCDKVLWMNDGELVTYGHTGEVMDAYTRYMKRLK
ncbi:MAG: ABC transporter ATP-binding protein [Lachnospiraceae bacterium]|nr:ABC transporter ATP-binding protein [Lachnospiraceae bacterium]